MFYYSTYNQFLCAIFETYKDKITDIKKISGKIATAVNLPSFFRQFLKPLATSNTCIFVNIVWKMNCDILLKSKLIFCEWNAFYFIEIAFIGFTLHWDTRYIKLI